MKTNSAKKSHLHRKQNERATLSKIERMCEESLSPDAFKKWEEVKTQLQRNRSL